MIDVPAGTYDTGFLQLPITELLPNKLWWELKNSSINNEYVQKQKPP